MWFDAHNHLHDPRLDALDREAIEDFRALGIDGMVVNGTHPDNWQAVSELATRHPDFYIPAFGIHPWHVHRAPDDWPDILHTFLEKHSNAVVGEIGLDLWMENPNLTTQLEAYKIQCSIAEKMNRSVAIHCLKAWNPFFENISNLAPLHGRILIHGFTGSAEIANQLMSHGCYLGFGGYLLHPRKARSLEVFGKTPLENILLETDAPDMAAPEERRTHFLTDHVLNHPGNLAMHGHALAELRGLDPEKLAAALRSNTKKWLGNFSV